MDEPEREYLSFLMDFCVQVLEKRPCYREALENAANAMTALGYYEDGLRMDSRLSRLFPDDPGILYNLACSLALTTNTEEALDALEKSIYTGYKDARHMVQDSDLESLQDHPRFSALLTKVQQDD